MRVKWILLFLLFPAVAFSTISESRKILGVLKSYDKENVQIISNEKIIIVDAPVVAKKYSKLNVGMLIELNLTPEEFSKVKSRDQAK